MPDATASTTYDSVRKRMHVRMELSPNEYLSLKAALTSAGKDELWLLLTAGEREKAGELDWERYSGSPKVGD